MSSWGGAVRPRGVYSRLPDAGGFRWPLVVRSQAAVRLPCVSSMRRAARGGCVRRVSRCPGRRRRFLLLTGVIFALAFAWINIGKIGGPNDHAESGSNTDDTATAPPRHAGTAGTDADTAAEDPSSEPAKEMSQPDTTGRLAVYTGNTQRHEN